jgi:hypothetical protein
LEYLFYYLTDLSIGAFVSPSYFLPAAAFSASFLSSLASFLSSFLAFFFVASAENQMKFLFILVFKSF